MPLITLAAGLFLSLAAGGGSTSSAQKPGTTTGQPSDAQVDMMLKMARFTGKLSPFPHDKLNDLKEMTTHLAHYFDGMPSVELSPKVQALQARYQGEIDKINAQLRQSPGHEERVKRLTDLFRQMDENEKQFQAAKENYTLRLELNQKYQRLKNQALDLHQTVTDPEPLPKHLEPGLDKLYERDFNDPAARRQSLRELIRNLARIEYGLSGESTDTEGRLTGKTGQFTAVLKKLHENNQVHEATQDKTKQDQLTAEFHKLRETAKPLYAQLGELTRQHGVQSPQSEFALGYYDLLYLKGLYQLRDGGEKWRMREFIQYNQEKQKPKN